MKFKVGDHIIITNDIMIILRGEKGVVIELGFSEDTQTPVCLIELDKEFDYKKYVSIHNLKLDLQYYREERLNKLLK